MSPPSRTRPHRRARVAFLRTQPRQRRAHRSAHPIYADPPTPWRAHPSGSSRCAAAAPPPAPQDCSRRSTPRRAAGPPSRVRQASLPRPAPGSGERACCVFKHVCSAPACRAVCACMCAWLRVWGQLTRCAALWSCRRRKGCSASRVSWLWACCFCFHSVAAHSLHPLLVQCRALLLCRMRTTLDTSR